MKISKTKLKQKAKEKIDKISYYRKPDNLNIDQWQVALRKQFGQENSFEILNLGNQKFFSDYEVFNFQTKNAYKVSLRSTNDSFNFCECLDFKTNRLGVCKHISAVLQHVSAQQGGKKALKDGPKPISYSSIYLDYKSGRKVKLRIGTENNNEFKILANEFFDNNLELKNEAFANFEILLEKANKLDTGFRCYSDALDYVLDRRDTEGRANYLQKLMPNGNEDELIDNLLKVKLFPYQKKGIFFAALAGRSLIADDMGLGKTIQAIAVAELYKQELGVNRVLIVCPTSLKYQWKSEIEKFSNSTVHVVEGNLLKRREQYEKSEALYNIVSYHIMANDVEFLNKMEFDMVFLDEAQRIKNWKTRVSQQIKKLQTPYAVVLTGTPLENKLEELYSIMQFVDIYKLGPMYKFLEHHQIKDPDTNKVIGYQNLNEIQKSLSEILIRRTKKEVLTQLPKRMDKNLFVPMTETQMEIHDDYKDVVARLVLKWRRMGFLNEKDRKRLMLSMSLMRMVCDSTYVIDQQTRNDTKIGEVINILEEAFVDPDQKAVVFSQWERMTRLIAKELDSRGIQYEYLHGGVESSKRKDLLDNFQHNPNSRVFLSTDAGGVGLNLQSASLLINMDIPWNPAVLEQRIARIYRLGQEKNVNIINMVSSGTIEHRMLDVLKFKSSMAEGVLDGGEDSIFLGDDKFKQFMQSIENLTGTVVDSDVPIDVSEEHEIEKSITTDEIEKQLQLAFEKPSTFVGDDDVKLPENESFGENPNEISNLKTIESANSTQDLIVTGLNFFTQLAKTLQSPEATQNLVKSITHKDETGNTYLKIPIENEAIIQNAIEALSGILKPFLKN